MDETEKILIEISSVKEEFKDHTSITKRLDNMEIEFDQRIGKLEADMKTYNMFVSKSSGFFTRLGFYGDVGIIWLRGLWKNKGDKL